MLTINPRIAVAGEAAGRQICLVYGGRARSESELAVDAWGWNVGVNVEAPVGDEIAPPAALAAAAFGVGEVFRSAFGHSSRRTGRSDPMGL